MIAREETVILGGGQVKVRRKALLATDQGSSGIVAPRADAIPLLADGGWDADNGRLQCRLAAGATIADGAEESLCDWTRNLLTEWPDYDPTRHLLFLEIDRGCLPSGTVESTLFLGVFGATLGVGADGLAIIWSQGSLSADNIGHLNATTSTFVGGGDNMEGVRALVGATPLSTAYELRALGRGTRQDMTEDAGPASWGEISTIPDAVSAWQFRWGLAKRSVDDQSALTVSGARFYTGLIELTEPDRPAAPARLAKKTSGTINVCLWGDSIADGVGGSTGGGAALPGYVVLYVDGVLQTNWPADAGIMPQLAANLNAQGYATVRIFQRALTSQYIEVTVGQYLPESISACYDVAGMSDPPDLIVTTIGTNDGNGTRTPTQVALWPRQLRNAMRRAEWASLKARWIHLSPLAAVATHADINTIRSGIQSVCAESPYRAYVDCSDLARADNAHPTAGSYNTMGTRAATAWAALS